MTVPTPAFLLSQVKAEVSDPIPGFMLTAGLRTLTGVASGAVQLSLAAGKSWLNVSLNVSGPTYSGTVVQTQRWTLTATIVGGSGSYTHAWSQIGTSPPSTFTGGSGSSATVQQSIDTTSAEDYTATDTTVQLILTDTVKGVSRIVTTVVHMYP